MSERMIVIGAGPGGLAAAMLLASKGYQVDVYEKQPWVGGRNAELRLGDFTFDTGPTFLSMLHLVEELFEATGRSQKASIAFRVACRRRKEITQEDLIVNIVVTR